MQGQGTRRGWARHPRLYQREGNAGVGGEGGKKKESFLSAAGNCW